ncbi:MAG: SCO family protein [Magnetococcales bacterium]|nr:SCO family protein [Magnetococcales bacterium]
MRYKSVAAVLVIAGLLGWQLYRAGSNESALPAELSSIVLPYTKPLEPFSLTDQEGQPFTLAHLQGRWSFLFFGYTHCPDVCPTAMGMLGGLFQRLQEQDPPSLANSQGVFVTVDPKRDTPPQLKQYVTYFNPGFKGLSGSEAEIKQFSRQLGVYYNVPDTKESKDSGAAGGSTKEEVPAISHASSLFLIDPLGRLVAIFPDYNKMEVLFDSYEKIRKAVRSHQTYANPDYNR